MLKKRKKKPCYPPTGKSYFDFHAGFKLNGLE